MNDKNCNYIWRLLILDKSGMYTRIYDEIYGNRNKLNTDDNVIIEKNNTINDLYMDDFNEIEKYSI